jgi:hypothetical protein
VGILTNLLQSKTPTTITFDDSGGVTDLVWKTLIPTGFAKITKLDLVAAVQQTDRNLDAQALLSHLQTKSEYKNKDRDEFTKLFNSILSEKENSRYREISVTTIKDLRPGDGVSGKSLGTIGGFLTNNAGEIFFFSDAHVLVQNLCKPVEKRTPSIQITDTARIKNNILGKVVCSSTIRKEAQQNLDIALVRVEPQYHSSISLQYQGTTVEGDTVTFMVDKVDDKLAPGKAVFLFGHSSGVRKGTLKDSKPESVGNAPYHSLIGEKTPENITLHDCLTVEQGHKKWSLTLEGDSGGLWVSADGAVGLQLLGGSGTFEASIHPMTLVMKYFHDHFDGSLRFLRPSDLTKRHN